MSIFKDFFYVNLMLTTENFKKHIEEQRNWRFEKMSIEDEEGIDNIFKIFQITFKKVLEFKLICNARDHF